MSKSAYQKNRELHDRLLRLSDQITLDDAAILRRAACTLTRWACLECGDGNNWASWAIERDEATDVPYFVTYRHDSNKPSKRRIADREKGALRRVAAICQRLSLHFYHQTDPRGWPLYLDKEPLLDNNYNHGVGIGGE